MTSPQDIRALFREEADERIDEMSRLLMLAERGEASTDTVSALLRHAHSIKGGAGMIGLDATYGLAHAIEETLAHARECGQLETDASASLLAATDALRTAVSGDDEEGAAAAARRLAAAREGTVAPPPGDSPPASDAAPAAAATASLDARAPSTEEPTGRRWMRVDARRVDRLLDDVGEAGLEQRRLQRLIEEREGGRPAQALLRSLERGRERLGSLQDEVLELRMLPLAGITTTFERAVRDIAVAHDKDVELTMRGMETHLDRVVLEGTRESLAHLLRNAVAHGIETPAERLRSGKPPRGQIELRAEQRGDSIAIEVTDDGRGVAAELVGRGEREGSLAHVLAESGLSTASAVTDVSGRGVGLDAVVGHIESLRGTVDVSSEPGRGTTVSLLLPLSLALVRVLVAERGGQAFCIPLAHVDEVVVVEQETSLLGARAVELHGEIVPLVDLLAALGGSAETLKPRPPAVVVTASGRRAAVACDSVEGERELLLKSLGPLLDKVPGYLGCTIMADGHPALVVDPAFLAKGVATVSERSAPAPEPDASAILVVDDQFAVRQLQKSILETAGYRVETARTGREAIDRLRAGGQVDAVVTDIEMPEMDGLELLDAVRQEPELAELTVIVVTSRSGAQDERRGLEAGADAYIVKERFDQQALLETVERLIGR